MIFYCTIMFILSFTVIVDKDRKLMVSKVNFFSLATENKHSVAMSEVTHVR